MMNPGKFILTDENGSWYTGSPVDGNEFIACYDKQGNIIRYYSLSDYPMIENDQDVFTAVCKFGVSKKILKPVTPVTYRVI